MAAIDTIVVQDNLQFTQGTDSDIYTADADGISGESVISISIPVSMTYSAIRVIINNDYGATGSQVHARVKATGVTDTTPTKYQNIQALEWTAIALGSSQEATEIDTSGDLKTDIHIDVAITGTTTHLGTEIIVQGRKEASVDEWSTIARPVVLSGLTAFKTDVSVSSAAGQTVISVANPVASNLDHDNKFLFILNTTVANSEIVFQTEHGADS